MLNARLESEIIEKLKEDLLEKIKNPRG